MRADNSRFLVQAARDRHEDALKRALLAVKRLDRSGEPVTFRSVSQAGSVSRTWLYRQPELRAEIERLRPAAPHAQRPAVPAAQHASAESLRQQLQALHDEARRLREENRQLRDQAARILGEQRARRTRHDAF